LEGQNTQPTYQTHYTQAHKHTRIKSQYNGETGEWASGTDELPLNQKRRHAEYMCILYND